MLNISISNASMISNDYVGCNIKSARLHKCKSFLFIEPIVLNRNNGFQ